MKILFLSHGRGEQMDYAHDCLLHGLKDGFGDEVVDFPRVDYIYQGYPTVGLYGRGFTLAANLPEDLSCDRNDIEYKIKNRFFELVVFGSVTRESSLLPLVVEHYRRSEIVLVDGEDFQWSMLGLVGSGLYFKREIAEPHEGVYPIHFAMPRSKIRTIPLEKNQYIATCDPRDRSTYIFVNERDYYADYARSMFAYTTAKGGWDCMRHQEIIGCGCIPWFLGIDDCPAWTCTNLPKAELREALELREKPREFWESNEGHAIWSSLYRRIYTKWAPRSTTTALAEYVISVSNGAKLQLVGSAK